MGIEGKDAPFQFFAGEDGLLILGGILRSRTIFGLGVVSMAGFEFQKVGRGVQHGALMETWALRMCLLRHLIRSIPSFLIA